MSDLFPVPDNLNRAEYAQMIFHLETSEYFDLPPLGLLRLRREFQQAIRALNESGDDALGYQLQQLLEPPLPIDEKLRKLVQRPAPAFILNPDLERSGLVEPGDCLELPVLFLGRGIQLIEPFTRLLQQVGRQGLVNRQGICELVTIECEDASGCRTSIWNVGSLNGTLTPVVNDLEWWLKLQSPDWGRLQLDFVSPTRLLHGGKPLFKAGFSELFPFVLRRVTSMLAAHCDIETVTDPASLLAASRQVEELSNHLQWRDWRALSAEHGGQDLGGLCGVVELAGSGLADILWILQLGSLLQVGKGAPYGAGRYNLS